MTSDTLRTLPATGTWAIDPTHTIVGLSVRHLMAAKVRGSFRSFSGALSIGESAETSSVQITIDAASIDTGVEDRDNHLRSADFLDAENHPTITFQSTAVQTSGNGYNVEGDLTIRGVSNPVTLSMDYLGLVTDPWGNEKALFSASADVERATWGLSWNQALETGGWLVGKTLHVELEVQATQASE